MQRCKHKNTSLIGFWYKWEKKNMLQDIKHNYQMCCKQRNDANKKDQNKPRKHIKEKSLCKPVTATEVPQT